MISAIFFNAIIVAKKTAVLLMVVIGIVAVVCVSQQISPMVVSMNYLMHLQITRSRK